MRVSELLVLSLLVIGICSANPSFAQTYEVAAGAIVVTPKEGGFLAGYGPDRRSTGSHDDLFIKTVVVADNHQILVLMTLDSIGLTYPDIQRIQAGIKQSLPKAKLIFSSTHTHAGPDVVGIWGPALWRSGRDENYIDDLIDKAVALAIQTHANKRAASSRVLNVNKQFAWVENVSEPDLLDTGLGVMQFVDRDGNTVATLTNFACHPTVLGPENTDVSADFVAGFYQQMHAEMPGQHLFLQGAIGGWVQPLQGDRSHERARMLGQELASSVLDLLPAAHDNPYAPLAYAEQQLDIELDNWGFRLLIWLGVLERELYDGAMRTLISWFQIGQAQFVTHPGETSPAYSLASRQLMGGAHSFVLGLSQDAMGYILKPEYFADEAPYPHAEYLTSVSVGPTAGEKVMQTLRAITPEQKDLN